MDARSQAIIDGLHPKFKPSVQSAWEEAQAAMPPNVQVILIAGARTFAESDALYAIGRTVKGENVSPSHPMGDVVTNAPAGESFHNYNLAVDMDMVTNGKDDYIVGPNWMTVVSIMKKYGMEWGGDWHSLKDNPHFQNRYGFTWQELLAKHNAKDFIPGTEFVNI
jgi:peptidoglycan L-alanyl-D-glutamate endopeptidase CwlK